MSLSYGNYIGEFKEVNGEIINHGKGEFIFDSGNKYEGNWKDGKKDGMGVFTYATGEKYIGNFKEDKFDGMGKMSNIYRWMERW